MRDQCTYFSHSSGSLQAQAIKTGTTTTTAWLHILPAYRSTDPAPAPVPVVAAVPLRVVLVVVAVPFKKGARSTKEKVAAVSLFAWQQQQRRRRRQQQRRQQQLASGAGVAVRHLPHADRWQPL